MEEERKEHKCPESLEKLVLNIPKVVFEGLSLEPDINTLKEAMELDNKEVSEKELKERYKEFVRDYGEDQRTAFELGKYGNTREEIIQRLREETDRCVKCSETYLNLIKRIAIRNIQISKHWNPIIAALSQRYEGMSLSKIILAVDKEYLSLFGLD